jgi:integrase
LLDELGDKHLDAIGATVVRRFMAMVARRGIQARGPVNLLRTLLAATVERKWRQCSQRPEGWLRVAIALAAFAGLRQGEMRALEVRDVDLKAGVINVRRALSKNAPVAPKSGHERVVPLFPRLAEALANGTRGKLPAVRVVLNQSGRTPSRQAVSTELHALLIRHQLPERSYHALRHYFLTALVQGGQPRSRARAGRPLEAAHHATLRARHRRGSSRRDRAASG